MSVAETEQLYLTRRDTEAQVRKIAAQAQGNFPGTGVVAKAVQSTANTAVQASKSGKDEAFIRILAAKVDEGATRSDFLLATFSKQQEAFAAAKALHGFGIPCTAQWITDPSGSVVGYRLMIASADRLKITESIISALDDFKPLRGWNVDSAAEER